MLQKYDDKVDAYLKGNLSELEMNGLIHEYPDLIDEIEFRKNTTQAFTQNRFDELKNELRKLNTEYHQVDNSPKKFSRKWMVAASIALILSIGLLFYLNTQSSNTQKLYSAYFEPYPNMIEPIVRESTHDSDLNQAFAYYEQDDFSNAFIYFEKLKKDDDFSDEIYFYQGISALSSENLNSTEELFLKYLLIPDVRFKNQAEWYLALYYIRINEVEKSITLLKEIKNKGAYKHQEANEILSKLR